MRRSIAIEGDRVRRPTFIPNRLLKECHVCGYISYPAEPEVDSLPSLVYCPIQMGPFSAYLQIGFIDSPQAASAAAKESPPLDELWHLPSNPAQDHLMGKLEPSFDHHLHQITEAELLAQIPTHAQKDHTAVKVPSCKQHFDVYQPAHCQSSITKTTLSNGISLFAPEPSALLSTSELTIRRFGISKYDLQSQTSLEREHPFLSRRAVLAIKISLRMLGPTHLKR